jgi:hypothetical protein
MYCHIEHIHFDRVKILYVKKQNKSVWRLCEGFIGQEELLMLRDEELVKIVLDSDEFKRAASINEVKSVVRRLLRKQLIDLHIDDSNDVTVRECLVNRHIEWITLKILNDVDGILLIPEYYDDLEYFVSTRDHNPVAGCGH